ncbi:hypothetical protein O206_09775 [Ochrobactrum sp. EGD-AQ16]|nr:hypothetical protein O206_09775 [Ochrobactrum sp. EGD-AQ16]
MAEIAQTEKLIVVCYEFGDKPCRACVGREELHHGFMIAFAAIGNVWVVT